MNLEKRRELASRVLGVGKNKVYFNPEHLNEIKEAITKQDIRDLFAEGIIGIKESRGKMKKEKRKTRRGPGSIKKTVFNRKAEYIILVRKFRNYINELRKQGKLTKEKYIELRKKIKARAFKNKAHLRDYIGGKA